MLEDLNKIAVAEHAAQKEVRHCLRICLGPGCLASQSELVREAIEAELKRRALHKDVQVKGVGCMGPCALGPLVTAESSPMVAADVDTDSGPGTLEDAGARLKNAPVEPAMYRGVTPADAAEIVDSLVGPHPMPVERLRAATDVPFFKRQTKIVLENMGRIDPERIEDYIAAGGYRALLKALTEMTPQQVIDEVTKSGLRGRGGAGYPTGLKWGTVAKATIPLNSRMNPPRKYVICNGDEGDPGAYMDRGVMEGDPHRVIEGMAIAAYAVGASQGFVYVRAEYPLAVKRLRAAIRQAQRLGLLGNSIGGTGFSFDIDIRLGAGAFVCGEETALIASIEGGRGTPRPRPPFPAVYGVWGCPTLINNVETFANIAPIVNKGGEWLAGIGTEKSKGTKVFALAGQVAYTGLIEVPMGISLREVIFEIGGGIPDGHAFKAVQTGGPSGGCIPAEYLDMPVDYESLAKVGSIMGSGGMIVMNDQTDMVAVARYFMEFCMEESCGKCIPCRAGTAQMYHILTRIQGGQGTRRDLTLLTELCDVVKHCSLCGLGQSAPNPLMSTMRYFGDEYEHKVKV
jgi:bidirectional [NiFe] hydrogenase diaphorase subunit